MKKLIASLLTALMLLGLCACGSTPSAPSTPDTGSGTSEPAPSDAVPSGETMLLRLANSHNAEHVTSQACQMFADLVNEKTGGRITIEAHVLGFEGDLYGRSVRLGFVERLRSEKQFPGLEDLRQQLEADGRATRRIVSARR